MLKTQSMIRIRNPFNFVNRVKIFSFPHSRMESTNEIGLKKHYEIQQIRSEFSKFHGGSITLSKDETNGIAFICIDHPIKKNGLSGKMMVDLNDIVTSLEKWTTGKGLIFYGKGSMFCSGGYLETVKQICTHEDGFKMSTLMQDSTSRLRRLPLLSVSIIHGMAIGGGSELSVSTDCRLMTESAEVAFVQGIMGVGTGWGGGCYLTQLVGRPKALDLLLTCRKVTSTEALALGLADEIIMGTDGEDEESRLKYVIDWISKRIKHHAPNTVHTLKQIVHCENLEDEKLIFSKSWGGTIQQKILSENIKHK